MELTVDARGESCPIPVVRAKQALSTIDEGTVLVLVDNRTAVTNLQSLAKSLGCESAVEEAAENDFTVRIDKAVCEECEAAQAIINGTASSGPKVVVISSSCMGTGDDALGAQLMKAFIFALTQQDTLPDTILFYNGGVHLTCEGSASLEDLKGLAQAGVEILSCGTCLKNYQIEDKLAVGEVTNMYVIVEKQLGAGVVVRP